MIRKFLRWTGISLICLATILLAIRLLASDLESLYQSVNPSAFEAEAWRGADIRTRGTMVDDLIGRGILAGATREEVVALLGPPDFDRPDSLRYTVDIGTRWGSTVWAYQLHVYFDKETGQTISVFYTD